MGYFSKYATSNAWNRERIRNWTSDQLNGSPDEIEGARKRLQRFTDRTNDLHEHNHAAMQRRLRAGEGYSLPDAARGDRMHQARMEAIPADTALYQMSRDKRDPRYTWPERRIALRDVVEEGRPPAPAPRKLPRNALVELPESPLPPRPSAPSAPPRTHIREMAARARSHGAEAAAAAMGQSGRMRPSRLFDLSKLFR